MDNHQRAVFFGREGDTRWRQKQFESTLDQFAHHEIDSRDRQGVLERLESA